MTPEWCEFFKDYYVDLWPRVKACEPWQWAVDPNAIDWQQHFSPIERIVWGFIREEGLVMYPQHPCAGYFVDFGHPKARVAIECDGEMFHQDKAKDAARQAAIEAKGWTVYRLTGSQCARNAYGNFTVTDEEQDDPPNPAQALIRQIGRDYRLSSRLLRESA